MKHDMLYVCLTRPSKQEYANFCDIECHKLYTGYSHIYSYNDIYYICCTTDVKRKDNINIETIKQISLVGH